MAFVEYFEVVPEDFVFAFFGFVVVTLSPTRGAKSFVQVLSKSDFCLPSLGPSPWSSSSGISGMAPGTLDLVPGCCSCSSLLELSLEALKESLCPVHACVLSELSSGRGVRDLS